MSDHVVVFMHLIKTGGSTIANHMITHMRGVTIDQDAKHYAPQHSCQFFSGHGAYFGLKVNEKQHRYMTIVRDPADWYVSGYHHQMARDRVVDPPSFEKWYERKGTNSVNTISANDNRMASWFANSFAAGDIERAFEILGKCWFVGITSHLDEDLPHLFKAVGAPITYVNRRVAGEYDPEDGVKIKKLYTLTQDMRELIYEENPLDLAFYELAKDRRDETRGNLWQ